jgi:LysR family nitrogen assimilation transcriptional regulator
VTLTDAGRRLLEHGHAIMQRVALAKEDLGSQRDEPVGRIVVGLPPSLARRLTLPLIDRFSREMPKAGLAVVEGFSVNMAEWLTSGRMDLALVYTPEPQPQVEERLCLIGPASMGQRSAVRFEELSDYPLVMPQRGQIFRKLMEAQATLSQVKLNVVWEVSSVPAILDLVRGGYGYAALTASALSSLEHGDELACIPIESPGIVSTLCMAQSSKKKSTPLIRRTSELLRELCLEAVGRGSRSS